MTRSTNATLAGITYIVYIAAGLASTALARKAPVVDVLTLVTSLSAVVLGVTLYAITRDENQDLAMLAMMCRIVEAIPLGVSRSAFFFAVGSTIFCWLLLRGRMIPAALAWLGVVASVLLVVLLPLQTAGLFRDRAAWYSGIAWLMWMPMLAFELTVAVWFIVRGVGDPARSASAQS